MTSVQRDFSCELKLVGFGFRTLSVMVVRGGTLNLGRSGSTTLVATLPAHTG